MDAVIHTTPTCRDLRVLKRWLEVPGIPYEERDLTDVAVMEEAGVRTEVRVAPITFVGDEFLCGTFAEQRTRIMGVLGMVSEGEERGANP